MKVSEQDKEIVRETLKDLAEFVRKRTNMTIPEIRSFLREMLEVSV